MSRRADAAHRPLRGRLRVPGDKSISHRAVLLGALGSGSSVIRGLNSGDDVARSVAAVRRLGVEVVPAAGEVVVEGRGPRGLEEPADVIDAGNSGTTLRVMAGICAAVQGLSVLTGDDSLRSRPMLRVVDPLRAMGAAIDGRRGGDLAPLAIRGGGLSGINLNLTVASAQVKTALLLAGLSAEGRTTVTEPAPSRDHTEIMLASMGAPIERHGLSSSIAATDRLDPFGLEVPGDLSSALYLIAAALLVPHSELAVESVGLNPTRSAALDVLRRMGADIELLEPSSAGGEPVGTVVARSSQLEATTISGAEIPSLIDELPVLAVLASQAEGETVIADAAELRIKESDRIASIVEGLHALGAAAEETPDGLVVRGPRALTGGEVESHGDHRIALSFGVAGLVAAGEVKVREWSCTETSFPEFRDLLARAQAGSPA